MKKPIKRRRKLHKHIQRKRKGPNTKVSPKLSVIAYNGIRPPISELKKVNKIPNAGDYLLLFDKAIHGENIYTEVLRAIYTELEILLTEKNKLDFHGYVNSMESKTDQIYGVAVDYGFIEKATKNSKSSVFYLIYLPVVTSKATKSLLGKYVLLQIIYESKSGQVDRFFAWGIVADLNTETTPHQFYIKILSDTLYSEIYQGQTIGRDKCMMLRIADRPVPLTNSLSILD